MSEVENQRARELEEWLANHVATLADPLDLTLFDFNVDWTSWKGSFRVKLDDTALKERFWWQMAITGLPSFSVPLFTSPLGVPASFAAIEMSDALHAAIQRALEETFPKLSPLGRNRQTSVEITYQSPIESRLSAELIRKTKARVTSDYAINQAVGG